MDMFGKMTRSALVAGLLLAAAPAFADDFVAVCKPGVEPGKNPDKICTCMSGKVTTNRADAIAAMKLMGDSKGNPDPNAITPAFTQALMAVSQAEAECTN